MAPLSRARTVATEEFAHPARLPVSHARIGWRVRIDTLPRPRPPCQSSRYRPLGPRPLAALSSRLRPELHPPSPHHGTTSRRMSHQTLMRMPSVSRRYRARGRRRRACLVSPGVRAAAEAAKRQALPTYFVFGEGHQAPAVSACSRAGSVAENAEHSGILRNHSGILRRSGTPLRRMRKPPSALAPDGFRGRLRDDPVSDLAGPLVMSGFVENDKPRKAPERRLDGSLAPFMSIGTEGQPAHVIEGQDRIGRYVPRPRMPARIALPRHDGNPSRSRESMRCSEPR